MSTRPIVRTIGEGGGYVLRGEHSHAECIELIKKHLETDPTEDEDQADYTRLEYRPGFFRWRPAERGSDYKQYIEDAEPGSRGSFIGVYMESPLW